LKTFFSPIRFI